MLHPPSVEGPTKTNPTEMSFAKILPAKNIVNKNATVFFIYSFEFKVGG